MARDREVSAGLRREGWTVIRLWATDVLRNVEKAADKVERAVRRAEAERNLR